MKNLFIVLGLASLLLAGCGKEADKFTSYVEVAGYAEKEAEPDIFYLNFTLSENNSPKSNVNALEKKIVDDLNALGIDTQQALSVTSMSGDNWSWWRKRKAVYQNKSYSLKMNDIALLNKVCDKLDTLGYNNYYLAKIENSQADELKKEVQQEAVKKAREKAENLLAGENKQVGEIIYLQEQEARNLYPNYRMANFEYDQSIQNDSAQPLNFQKIKMTYSVIVRYSIK